MEQQILIHWKFHEKYRTKFIPSSCTEEQELTTIHKKHADKYKIKFIPSSCTEALQKQTIKTRPEKAAALSLCPLSAL